MIATCTSFVNRCSTFDWHLHYRTAPKAIQEKEIKFFQSLFRCVPMRKNAYMTARERKREMRDRTTAVSAEQIRAFARSASLLSAQLAALTDMMEINQFNGTLDVDGGHLIGDLFQKLHGLSSKMIGRYYGSLTVIPETVPESGANTRKNVAESRVLPQPSERPKPKKTP